MSSSGVNVSPDCLKTFQQLAEGKQFRYIIYVIKDREVTVEKAVKKADMASAAEDDHADNSKASFNEFVDDLKTLTGSFTDCRYAVFDFKFTCHREGAGASKMDKIIFIQLCPDGASIKLKMVYASSAAAIKQTLGTGKMLQVQASGVKVSPECKTVYDDMHNRKMHAYIIFRISDDDKLIIVEKHAPKGTPYQQFIDDMGASVGDGKECRYACVDVEFSFQRQGTDSAAHIQKIVFVQFCPDNSPVRKRMLYASSVRSLKASLGLESLMQVQASDMSDIDEKAIKHELMSSQRM